jgi:hypothetical protein
MTSPAPCVHVAHALLLVVVASAATLPHGVLDVTQPPYNADPTGNSDTTAALQKAIEAAYDQQLAAFFPSGRYLVTDTLMVAQKNERDHGDGGVNIVPARFRPNVLIGSTLKLPSRPTIVLKTNSTGFSDPKKPKNLMKITNPHAENINMNQIIRGIDLEIEDGNGGAVALYFHGAQGGAAQDITVRMASGFAGFGGGGGAGTSHVNVQVIGGQYGIWFKSSEPGPLVGSATLTNQTTSAVLWGSQQSMVLVGLHIIQSPYATG